MSQTPKYDSIRKAGVLFGLDLSGLFDDSEGGAQTGFEGFKPYFEVETELKGRSPSTLTYKTPKTPSRTVTFGMAPAMEGAPGTPAPAPQTQERPRPSGFTAPIEQQKEFTWSSKAGTEGFGPLDLQAARAQGYSDAAIKDFLTKNAAAFGGGALNIGTPVREQLGLGTEFQSDLAKIASSAATGGRALDVKATPSNWRQLTQARGGIGLEAFNQARAGGASSQDIEDWVKSKGLTVGALAAEANPSLYKYTAENRAAAAQGDPRRTKEKATSSNWKSLTSARGGIGAEAIQRAREGGASDAEIRAHIASQGLTVGPAAAAMGF